MQGNLFVLQDVTDFAPGAFENVAVEDGGIQLGHRGGEYLAAGCYTSPPFSPAPFVNLVPSWNADTPPGTAVEVQVRVAAGRRWSRWFSFGRWSPFINRESPELQKCELARCNGETITMLDTETGGQNAQIRIFLYTNNAEVSPRVRLLALCAEEASAAPWDGDATNRVLPLPAYSCLVRDPSIAGRIATPTSLTMLMNRWGKDLLPEEVARSMYDTGMGSFGNIAFSSAVAGAFGFSCYARYCGIGPIRREVRLGRAVAAQVRYRAPALAQRTEEEEAALEKNWDSDLPVLPGATYDSSGHLVIVHGFVLQNDEQMVLMHDPISPTNQAVPRCIPLAKFAEIYTGLSFVLYPPPHQWERPAGYAKPERTLTQMSIEDNMMYLSAKGEALEPGRSIPGDASRATICYTVSDGVAYASAAQRKFYYVKAEEGGLLRFDKKTAAGHKITIYLVGSRGTTWVAQKMLEPEPVPVAPYAPAPEEKQESPS